MWLLDEYEQNVTVFVQVKDTPENVFAMNKYKKKILAHFNSPAYRSTNPTSLGGEKYGFQFMFENTDENWYDFRIVDIKNYRKVNEALLRSRVFFGSPYGSLDFIEKVSISMECRSLRRRSVSLSGVQKELKNLKISTHYDNSFFPRLCFRTTLLNKYPKKKPTSSGKKYEEVPKECYVFLVGNGTFEIKNAHNYKFLNLILLHLNALISSNSEIKHV